MKKLHWVLKAMLFPFLATCQPDTFHLTIHTSAVSPGAKAYLLYQFDGNKVVDSAINQNNKFTFSQSISRPLRASLVLDYQHAGLATLLKSRGVGMEVDVLQLYIHPGKITGHTQSRIAVTRFEQSTLNGDFQAYQKELQNNTDRLIELSKQMVSERDTLKLKLQEISYDSLTMIRMPIIKSFIITHRTSYIGLVAWQDYNGYLQKLENYNQISPERLTESKKLYDQLSAEVKNTVEGKTAGLLFINDELLKPGSSAPDFSQPDATGKMIKLSNFKGSYVLLDFWASWCGPCRKNNPDLVKLYNQYAKRKFTILGISLDEKDGRKGWLKAIKDDGLIWTQVSDLKHWDNQVVKLYSISAIPQSILIGPDGKIIANSPGLNELKQILEKVLPTEK